MLLNNEKVCNVEHGLSEIARKHVSIKFEISVP